MSVVSPEYEQIVKELHARGMVTTSIISNLSPKEVQLAEAIYVSSQPSPIAPSHAIKTARLNPRQASESAKSDEN